MVNVGPGDGQAAQEGQNPFINKDSSNGGFIPDKNAIQPSGNDAKALKDRMIAAYQRYAQLLSEGKGETAEGQQALQEYKQAFNAYEEFMSKSQAATSSTAAEKGK
jgi:hypothetical protein